MRMGIGLLTILLAPYMFGAGLAGTWEGTFNDAQASYAGFDLEVSGNQLTGEAYLAGWGFSRVIDGRVDGKNLSFTVSQTHFQGAIDGDTISVASTPGGAHKLTLHRTVSHVTDPIRVQATAKDLEGEWDTLWTGPIGNRPKAFGSIRFHFLAEGDALVGTARMGSWPGDCPISGFKMARGRFSFTATGRTPSSSGIPVMRFEGEIHGSQLTLTMQPDTPLASGRPAVPLDAMRN